MKLVYPEAKFDLNNARTRTRINLTHCRPQPPGSCSPSAHAEHYFGVLVDNPVTSESYPWSLFRATLYVDGSLRDPSTGRLPNSNSLR